MIIFLKKKNVKVARSLDSNSTADELQPNQVSFPQIFDPVEAGITIGITHVIIRPHRPHHLLPIVDLVLLSK